MAALESAVSATKPSLAWRDRSTKEGPADTGRHAMRAPKKGPARSATRAAAITTTMVTAIFKTKGTQTGSRVIARRVSDLELAAQLHHAVAGDAEELGGVQHVVGHEGEQAALPAREVR